MIAPITLPSLKEYYLVKDIEIESFRNNGHVLLRSVAKTEEINAYRPIINKAAYRFNTENRKLEDRDTYGKAFLQITNLWEVDDFRFSSYSLFKPGIP